MKLIDYITVLLNSKEQNWTRLANLDNKKTGVTVKRKAIHAIKTLNKILNHIGYEVFIREIEKK